MTGIERLRDWVGTLRLSGLVWADEMADELESTVDLIKREHAEDCHRMGLDHGAVSRVVSDMERHVSGVEGMEDSPVARWARELREALGAGHDHAEDMSVSAYDLLPEEERDAIAWVREHGGLDHVKAEWRSRVPHDLYERRRQRLLGHIAECETALGRRNERISEMEGLLKAFTTENGERVRRPVVLAADGEPLEVGQTVWDTDAESDTPLTVVEVSSDLVRCEYTWKDGKTYRPCYPPDQLTHTKPEVDTWQRIEEDARLKPFGYVDRVLGWDMSKSHSQNQARSSMTHDLVRRCRALAERERGV